MECIEKCLAFCWILLGHSQGRKKYVHSQSRDIEKGIDVEHYKKSRHRGSDLLGEEGVWHLCCIFFVTS